MPQFLIYMSHRERDGQRNGENIACSLNVTDTCANLHNFRQSMFASVSSAVKLNIYLEIVNIRIVSVITGVFSLFG